MKWFVENSALSGTIAIPPSKSHTIRALLVATLSDGRSEIRRALMKGDGASALRAARGLGAHIEHHDDILHVQGVGKQPDGGDDSLDMGNSGTSTNLFAAAAALGNRQRRIDGDQSLRSRPVKPLLTALESLGASWRSESEGRDLPFTICGPLRGGRARVDGFSSQFVSALLLSCPLARGDSEIEVYNLHERPYVELTLWWLDRQGITIDRDESLTHFRIPGNQAYTPFDMAIPSDFSSATFAAVAGALSKKPLRLTGLDFTDPQGDKGVFDIIESMGARVSRHPEYVEVCSTGKLQGRIIDLNSMPDALPALSVLACAAGGETRFVNVGQARIKETDRIAVMRTELSKMGAQVEEFSDGLVVKGGPLHGAVVDGHDDHRVVMALCIAGFIAGSPTTIDTAESAEVTYPTFVDDFTKIGGRIDIRP